MTHPSPPRDDAFQRPFETDPLPDLGREITIEATEAERAALAAQLDIPAIARLTATFRVRPIAKDGVRVIGEVRGEVTQTCVVSLDPVEETVVEAVDLKFLPPAAIEPMKLTKGDDDGEGFDLDPDAEDPPEPLIDNRIDLGVIAAEFLALGLDPYPRKPGVAFAPPEPDEALPSPFAALARLKDRGEG
jgi:uncharacterized metal-binding protein YceD (DUF177 family)